MCGREPNFELTVEEKDELSKLSWDEFLTMTRSAINSKSISTHPSFYLYLILDKMQKRTLVCTILTASPTLG